MTIEQIIYELNAKIEQECGVKNAIHTVFFNHKAFDEVIINLFRQDSFKYNFSPSDMNDLHIAGVRVLARKKEML